MENCCGKSCETCGWRERLDCPGCQAGPGRPFSGDCGIAACCREKGHASCGTCSYLSGCRIRADRDRAPEERLRRADAEIQRRRALDQRAPLLGRWLWVLFWLVVPAALGSLMTNETVAAALPALRIPGEALNLLCTLAYGFILWQLRQIEGGYRAASICNVVCAVGVVPANALASGEKTGIAAVLLLLIIPVEVYGKYREYNAHANVLDGADDALAEKWRKLWKWEIGLLLGLLGCTLLVLIAGMLGLILMLADAIGIIVVSVLKLVYLYRTAKLFRDHIPTETEALPE